MPKQRITKESVIDAAFELAKESGIEAVTVKSISQKLSCSVQPIYTYCANMEGLRRDVAEKVRAYVRNYVRSFAVKNTGDDIFKDTGRAYLRLAKEEPNIYKMFILCQRENISSLEELYVAETDPKIPEAISRKFGLSLEEAKKFHLNMLIFNIGMGAIFSGTSPGIPAEEIFLQQDQAFKAFLDFALKEK